MLVTVAPILPTSAVFMASIAAGPCAASATWGAADREDDAVHFGRRHCHIDRHGIELDAAGLAGRLAGEKHGVRGVVAAVVAPVVCGLQADSAAAAAAPGRFSSSGLGFLLRCSSCCFHSSIWLAGAARGVRIDSVERLRRQRQLALAVGHRQLLDAVVDPHFDRHREGAPVLQLPAQLELVAVAFLDQLRQRRVVQVGVEEPAEVAAAGFVGDGDEFPGAAVARFEVARLRRVGAVDHAARGAEEGVVADQVAQRVQDQRALGVDVVAGAAARILVDIFDAFRFSLTTGTLFNSDLRCVNSSAWNSRSPRRCSRYSGCM